MPVLIILVVVLLVVGWGVERELRRRRNVSVEALAVDIADDAAQIANDVRANLRRISSQPAPELTPKFKAWAQDHLEDEAEIRQWLLQLPPAALQALTEELHAFCRQLNIELMWLVDEALETEPKLREVVRGVVMMYCGNCLKAVELQPQILEFQVYQTYLKRIEQGRAQEFAQKLLQELVQAGLIDPPEPGMVLSDKDERRQYIAQILREAARRDSAAFKDSLARVATAS